MPEFMVPEVERVRVFADRKVRYLEVFRVMILFCRPTEVKIFH